LDTEFIGGIVLSVYGFITCIIIIIIIIGMTDIIGNHKRQGDWNVIPQIDET